MNFSSLVEGATKLTSVEVASVERVSEEESRWILFGTSGDRKLTPYFHFLFWCLIFHLQFQFEVWGSKVRCSMNSLKCGKICTKMFQAQGGRKMDFLKMNFVIHSNSPDTVINAPTFPPRPYKNICAYAPNSKFGSSCIYLVYVKWCWTWNWICVLKLN